MQEYEIAYIKSKYKCQFTINGEIVLINFKRKDSADRAKTGIDLMLTTKTKYNTLFIDSNTLKLTPKIKLP